LTLKSLKYTKHHESILNVAMHSDCDILTFLILLTRPTINTRMPEGIAFLPITNEATMTELYRAQRNIKLGCGNTSTL